MLKKLEEYKKEVDTIYNSKDSTDLKSFKIDRILLFKVAPCIIKISERKEECEILISNIYQMQLNLITKMMIDNLDKEISDLINNKNQVDILLEELFIAADEHRKTIIKNKLDKLIASIPTIDIKMSKLSKLRSGLILENINKG